MGDTPTAQNKAAEFFNNVIEALLEGGMEAAIVYITGVAPEAMAVPIVSWAVREGLSYLEQMVSKAGQKAATQIIIDVQTHGEQSSVITTATALQFALSSGNGEDIRIATDNAAQAIGRLVKFDGFAAPK